jgi:hypothetical protein
LEASVVANGCSCICELSCYEFINVVHHLRKITVKMGPMESCAGVLVRRKA